MTDVLKHECGIATIRLRKPLEYYQEKYGSWQYGLSKLYLLMEKQHNRGQEGAGLATVKLDVEPGNEFIFRERATGSGAIQEIFSAVHANFAGVPQDKLNDVQWVKENLPFAGELYLGHLRYSTTGKSGISYVHPFLRRSNWASRNLALCGNFNLTNVDEVFEHLVEQGQHPRNFADTFIMLEILGHYLDREVQRQYDFFRSQGYTGDVMNDVIEKNLDLPSVLRRASNKWDGGYVICGVLGCGDSFTFRDPWGIRPAFYYMDDEIVVTASERPVIQTVLNVKAEDVKELLPGQGLIVKKDGEASLHQINEPQIKKACSFERIYFSRGSDMDIYKERKMLGEKLVPAILKSVDNDLENSVFSFIPNTAEVAFFGMTEALNKYLNTEKIRLIEEANGDMTQEELLKILSMRVRSEKVAIKDIKLRTFIAEDNGRDELAAHVYDVTYGTVNPGVDNLVVIDDSIVRGTTLRQSIIKILDRIGPKKIVIVSSSPQIRYPDCYGIDMSRMGEFIAFRAAIELLKERGMSHIIDDVYDRCKAQQGSPKEDQVNHVKDIYRPFTAEEISRKIAEMLTPKGTKAEVEIVFQSLEGLHESCPDHTGDWYFSGDYPTAGGNRAVSNAFINYVEGSNKRSYK